MKAGKYCYRKDFWKRWKVFVMIYSPMVVEYIYIRHLEKKARQNRKRNMFINQESIHKKLFEQFLQLPLFDSKWNEMKR